MVALLRVSSRSLSLIDLGPILTIARNHRLALASYMYSLDGSTTYTYLSFATSSFGDHTFISSVQVAQSIISERHYTTSLPRLDNALTVAVGKPVIAKIADVSSRGYAYCFVCE